MPTGTVRTELESYQDDLLARRTSCEERTLQELSNIEAYNKRFNAFTRIFSGKNSLALARARELDDRLRRGKKPGPLFGLPITIKDNIFVDGFPTTNGSELFSGFVPAVNAEIVDALLAAGCIPMGKTNLHEMALGVTGTSGYGGPIRNAIDPARISGGSSGGSAVSVALSKGALASLGSDTGGSVRVPAALCGVCGFKPSEHLLSTIGVFPLSPTLDHLGLFTRTMADMGVLFRALAGRRPAGKDPVSSRRPLRLGLPDSYFTDDMDAVVSWHFRRGLAELSGSGDFRISEVAVREDFSRYSRARRTVMLREGAWFYENLLRSEKARRAMHPDVLSLLDSGLKTGTIEYTYSMNLRLGCIAAVSRLLSGGLDALVMPTCLRTAPKIDEVLGKETGKMRPLLLRNTELFNMCGFPALSVPINAGARGALQVAVQVVGRYGEDDLVVEVGERIWRALYARS